MTDHDKLIQIFSYMNLGNVPAGSPSIRPADGALVFCREDPEMAAAAATLFHRGLVRWIVLTGGIGKDSGPRSREAGSEAAHQRRLLVEAHQIPEYVIHLETKAHNGAENSRFGIDTIVQQGLAHERVILVMPPRYARRLYAVHAKIARDEKGFTADYYVVCMNDPFDPENPAHRQEVLHEFLRVADWPGQGFSDPQPGLSAELVAWVRAQMQG